MKSERVLKISSRAFILFSVFSLASVSIMAFSDPRSVMRLVGVEMNNTDAFSSIRGVYGGVGLTIVIAMLYLAKNDFRKGVIFLTVLWGSYAFSRLITIAMEGPLGAFGSQWIMIESVLFLLGLALILLNKKQIHDR